MTNDVPVEDPLVTSAREISPPRGTLPDRSAIVFTDIVGSTKLAQSLGDEWAAALTLHHRLIREQFDRHEGFEAGNQGDGFLYLFPSVGQAAEAAIAAHQALRHGSTLTEIRIGIHWGAVRYSRGVGFFGIDLHRAARVAGSAGPSQILLSDDAATLLALAPPPGTSLTDHGDHWLRDLRRPERLHAIAATGLSVDAPKARAATSVSLPSFPNRYVGREPVVAEIRELVDAPGGRVLTIVGMGGVGKTRTAVEVLRETALRTTFFVDVSLADHPNQVLVEIARTIGAEANSPATTESIASELDRHGAVVLIDNVEQVIDCAAEIGAIAAAAPSATVIVTSRIPLRIANEHIIEIAPLETAGNGAPHEDASAVTLFCATARLDPRPDTLASIERICALVDGLPLAIELAAQQVDLLGVDEIERQLSGSITSLESHRRDAPERHRSIDSTVRWSFALLGSDAQRVFGALSQFPAGATLDTLATLASLDRRQIVQAVGELVEHRLADRIEHRDSPTRFRMLHLIREVAAEELARRGELAATRRGIEQLLSEAARRSIVEFGATREAAIYQRLVDELDNYHHLFEWARTDLEAVEPALRCASDLVLFWWHEHRTDGIERLAELTALETAPAAHSYPRALVGMTILATYGGSPGRAIQHAREAVNACRNANRRGNTFCSALQQLAAAESAQGRSDAAMAAIDEAEPIARSLRSDSQAFQLVGLGNTLLGENHLDRAERAFADARTVFDELGSAWLSAAPVARLGECALRRGDSALAESLAREAIEMWQAAPGDNGRSRAWALLARIRWFDGHLDDARSIARDAAAWALELESYGDLPWALLSLGAVEITDGRAERGLRCLTVADALARAYAQPIHGVLVHELGATRRRAIDTLGTRADAILRTSAAATVADVGSLLTSS